MKVQTKEVTKIVVSLEVSPEELACIVAGYGTSNRGSRENSRVVQREHILPRGKDDRLYEHLVETYEKLEREGYYDNV